MILLSILVDVCNVNTFVKRQAGNDKFVYRAY